MITGIEQREWDKMTTEERKRELEARGYVDKLVIQTEIGEDWWDRFRERLSIRSKESLGVDVPEFFLEQLPFYVFSAIQQNSTDKMTRDLDSTLRTNGAIVRTINWPDVCVDLALLAYKAKE